MRLLYGLCIFLFMSVRAYAQELMIYTGLQNNLYFDFLDRNYNDSKSSLSSNIGFQYNHFRNKEGRLILLSLNYQKYNSYEKHRIGGYSNTNDSTYFNKSVLKLDFQPFGFHFEDNAFLNLGFGVEYRLTEVFSTHRKSSSMSGTITSIPFTNANSSYSKQVVPIISGTAGTKFLLYKNVNLNLQYQFSISVTPELKYCRAFKSFWILGISKSLGED